MKRSPILWLAGPALIVGIIGLVVMWSGRESPLPLRDFVEYWSAGKAFLDGRNPYDPRLLLSLQRQALSDESIDQPIMMWNPPWAFVLVAPLGFLSPAISHAIWLFTQLLTVLISASFLMTVYELPKDRKLIGFIAALIFCPFWLLIWYGQIGGLCLLGLSGYLYFYRRQKPMLSGGFAALTALKPHLLFAFGIMLIYNSVLSRYDRKVLFGGLIVISIAALCAWFINPMIYTYYYESITAPSTEIHYSVRDWAQPLASYKLRMAIDPGNFKLQVLPTIIASAIVLCYLFSQRIDPSKHTPRLIFVSVLCSAYGAWMFDLVVLLVPVIQALAWLTNHWPKHLRSIVILCAVYLLVNVVAGFVPLVAIQYFHTGVGLHEFIFFAPVILLLYALTGYVHEQKS